jgi:hypothetical protein
MIPTPIAVGLTLCDYVSIEEGTRKVHFLGSFRRSAVSGFPAVLSPF